MIQQKSREWHSAREKLLTASDYGAALGLNPYCSRQKLWRLKLGLETVNENEHMRRGNALEAAALHAYQVEAGVLVDESGLVVHPEHDWLGASPDATVGSDGLVEAKAPVKLRDAPPEYHVAQMQGQLEITDRAWCDYIQYVEGEPLRITRIVRDRDWWAWALPRLAEFWGYVQRLEQPPRKKRNA